MRTSFASRSLAVCLQPAISFGVFTSNNNAEAARQRRGGLRAPTAAVWTRAGQFSLGGLLLGCLALCPLQAQTAYFSGAVTPLGGGFGGPFGAAVDGSGNVYVGDPGNNAVKEIPPGCTAVNYTNNLCTITTLGGGFAGPDGVAVDGSGNVYVADIENNAVKEMPAGCATSSCVTTLGGGFQLPAGVAVDGSGNVYVGDTNNNLVKEMPPGCTAANYTNNLCTITTLGGGFNTPVGLAVDGSGNVYVADANNYAVKEIPSGCASSSCVTTLRSGFITPLDVALDGSGNVYVPVYNVAGAVYELDFASPPSLSFAMANVGAESSDSPKTATLENIGNAPLTFPVPGSGEDPSVSANFTLDSSTTCPEVLTSSSAGTLGAGASCVLAVDFIPTTTGPITGAVVLTDNNLNANPAATQSIGLSGTGETGLPMPTITWATPAAITYGSALSATQLDATAAYDGTKVAGTFAYTPAKGTVLGAGMQTLSAVFTPTKTAEYSPATASVMLQVNLATTKISWNKPAAITYGTALSGTQLDATASVPGTFTYAPDAGTVLGAGTQTLLVTFTPTESTDYLGSTDTVTITVNKAAPVLAWATPAVVSYGTALSGTQLDATASVPGTFAYSPAAGAVPAAGTDTLSVTFTPTGTTDYTTAKASASLQVTSSTPTITWANPAAITYGTALSATQLDATATYNGAKVAGTFTYSPAKGTVLGAGTQTLSVLFTPSNTSEYSPISASVTLQVNQATPKITWAKPAAITYGTALSATQLDATASVPGSLVYSPAVGTILGAGTQTLSVFLTPTDSGDYVTATDSLTITVNQAVSTTTITSSFPNPSAIGQSVTVAFKVTGSGVPTGTVTVTASSGQSCTGMLTSGTGSCALTFTAAGSPKLTAVYSGDGNFKTGTSSKVTQTVQ